MFVFLSETRLTVAEFSRVARRLGYDFSVGVDCDILGGGRSGGLGFMWKFDVIVELRSFST